MGQAYSPESQSGRQSRRPIRLPGFVGDEEVGLGDMIKRATALIGIRPCLGCAQRAAALNRGVVFTPRRGGRASR